MSPSAPSAPIVPFVVHVPIALPVADLNPVAYNPRKISPEKFEALKENIRTEGFLEPVIVQKEGLNIIGGHQRVRAVKDISVEAGCAPPDLPCIVLDIDDRRAKKLNIKLNNLKGDFEAKMLGELLVDIFKDDKIDEEEAQALGFTLDDAEKYIHIVEPEIVGTGDTDPISDFGRYPTLSVEFLTVEVRDRVKKLLLERVELEKKKPGDIIAEALGFGKKKPAKKTKAA